MVRVDVIHKFCMYLLHHESVESELLSGSGKSFRRSIPMVVWKENYVMSLSLLQNTNGQSIYVCSENWMDRKQELYLWRNIKI